MTTIQVHDNTLNLLKHFKAKYGFKTYEETILGLITKKEKIPKSMFGSNKKLTPFTHEDEAKFHEL